MLTFRQLDDLPETVLELVSETEQRIINDMARRITRLGSVTDATQYQLERLQAVGTAHDHIVRELSTLLEITEPELTRLFDEAATRVLSSDDAIYKAAGYAPVPLAENPVLQQIVWSGLQKTMNEFRNLTRTTALTATQQFERALDLVNMQLVSGGETYSQAIKTGIRELTRNGLETIRYTRTGWVDHLDVAFRRATLTGANQTALKLQEQRRQEMGCDIVEVSAHAGARNDGTGPMNHASWQGKRYRVSGSLSAFEGGV